MWSSVLGKIIFIVRVNPNTRTPQAGLEALYTNNGKQEPEKSDKERYVDKQWSCLLQTSKNHLSKVSIYE
jgi:hypothetical protein